MGIWCVCLWKQLSKMTRTQLLLHAVETIHIHPKKPEFRERDHWELKHTKTKMPELLTLGPLRLPVLDRANHWQPRASKSGWVIQQKVMLMAEQISTASEFVKIFRNQIQVCIGLSICKADQPFLSLKCGQKETLSWGCDCCFSRLQTGFTYSALGYNAPVQSLQGS